MKPLRIGNGCGFWGDSLDAGVRLAETGRLDVLTLEYLAELTMSILALQKRKNPAAGFATDFLDVLSRLAPALKAQPSLKVVTNAGGMNAAGCAEAARDVLTKAGLADTPIGVVEGDDLFPRLDELLAAGHALEDMDTGEPFAAIRERVVSANAYLGSPPIAEALRRGARVVITGRVADAALTVGPAAHHFGFAWDDWDRLCSASAAGHVIECGAQATGGLWINWSETELSDVGYPIAEMRPDGSFLVTKPEDTGGIVNIETVSEQILYEVGDPAAYLTPDVVADFTSLQLDEVVGGVVVRGARGRPAPDKLKVSVAYRDGFAASGTLVIAGPQAARKARRCGEIIFERLARVGVRPEHHLIECLGTGDILPGVLPRCDPPEVVLRVAVRDSRKEVVERFGRELAPLVTSGPPGVTGYTTGRPTTREVFAYRPTLIDRRAVTPNVRLIGGGS